MGGHSLISTQARKQPVATKLQQLTSQQDEIVALLDKRGVPLTDKGLTHRIEMLLDAKADVEKDIEFELSDYNKTIELLDEADIDAGTLFARVGSLLERTEDFLTLEDADQSEAIKLAHGNILPLMVASVLDRVRKLAVPYKSLSEFQQGELINSISRSIEVQFAAAVRILAAGDHPIVRAQLVDFTGKGTELKIKLTATKTIDNLTSLAKAGDQVLDIVFIDQSAINDGKTDMPQADVEQPALPLETAADRRDAQLARDLPNESEMLADEQPIVSGDPDAADSFDTPTGWGEVEGGTVDEDDVIPLASDDDDEDLDQSTTADDVDQSQENEVAR